MKTLIIEVKFKSDFIFLVININGDITQNLWGNCAFPQSLHTRKLGEITVFYSYFCETFFAQHFEKKPCAFD